MIHAHKRIAVLWRIAALALALGLVGCAQHTRPGSTPARPAAWAVAVSDDEHLPNCYRVNDSLYRGAQPDAEGLRRLREMGVRTVINLREGSSDREMLPEGMTLHELGMNTARPNDEITLAFLRIATEADAPVFVHCRHGADRTGMLCAVYRVVVEGWSKDDALREMTEGGYHFHDHWQNLIEYVRALDVDALRAALAAGAGK